MSDMLAKADLSVVGFDISLKMVALTQGRIKGQFSVSDMLSYDIEGKGKFAGVLTIFAHLQLSYADFHSAVYKFARVLKPGGILALGQMPSDFYVKDGFSYDVAKAYVEDYDIPFMREPPPTFKMSAEGQRKFLASMELEIVWENIDRVQPRNERCGLEEQQYIIARRADDKTLAPPKPFRKLSQRGSSP